MPKMDWDRLRRDELLRHEDVTLRSGRRQQIAESGPSSDGSLTRAERRQARLPFLYTLDQCAGPDGVARLVIGDGGANISFACKAFPERSFRVTIVGNVADSRIDAVLRCPSLREVAKSLRFE